MIDCRALQRRLTGAGSAPFRGSQRGLYSEGGPSNPQIDSGNSDVKHKLRLAKTEVHGWEGAGQGGQIARAKEPPSYLHTANRVTKGFNCQ